MKKSFVQILITALCMTSLMFVGCNKKAEDTAKTEDAPSAQQEVPAIPSDPAIDPKALIGYWTQTVDDDPSIYIFMENGKCKAKGLTDNAPKDCTYEIKTPDKTGSRFNQLVVDFPASGTEEHYYTESYIQLDGDNFTFPDIEGNVSEFNKYKRIDPNAVPAKQDTPTEQAQP